MKFLPSIAKLLLAGSITAAVAKNFDLIPPGWRLAWQNLTLSDRLDFSECALACEVTRRCVGGRFEPAADKCHLTLRSDDRWLAMYENKSAGADRVFGVTCNPKTGFYDQPGQVVPLQDIETHRGLPSIEECSALCAKRFWCRTLDWYKLAKICFLQVLGNNTKEVPDLAYHMRTRIC